MNFDDDLESIMLQLHPAALVRIEGNQQQFCDLGSILQLLDVPQGHPVQIRLPDSAYYERLGTQKQEDELMSYSNTVKTEIAYFLPRIVLLQVKTYDGQIFEYTSDPNLEDEEIIAEQIQKIVTLIPCDLQLAQLQEPSILIIKWTPVNCFQQKKLRCELYGYYRLASGEIANQLRNFELNPESKFTFEFQSRHRRLSDKFRQSFTLQTVRVQQPSVQCYELTSIFGRRFPFVAKDQVISQRASFLALTMINQNPTPLLNFNHLFARTCRLLRIQPINLTGLDMLKRTMIPAIKVLYNAIYLRQLKKDVKDYYQGCDTNNTFEPKQITLQRPFSLEKGVWVQNFQYTPELSGKDVRDVVKNFNFSVELVLTKISNPYSNRDVKVDNNKLFQTSGNQVFDLLYASAFSFAENITNLPQFCQQLRQKTTQSSKRDNIALQKSYVMQLDQLDRTVSRKYLDRYYELFILELIEYSCSQTPPKTHLGYNYQRNQQLLKEFADSLQQSSVTKLVSNGSALISQQITSFSSQLLNSSLMQLSTRAVLQRIQSNCCYLSQIGYYAKYYEQLRFNYEQMRLHEQNIKDELGYLVGITQPNVEFHILNKPDRTDSLANKFKLSNSKRVDDELSD